MSEPCVVLIGAPDLLPALRTRAGAVNGELIEFSHLDAVAALEAITKRRPQMVALERLFAMTARGAALINRVKADPSLEDVEIRVLAHDSDYTRVVPRAKAPAVAAPALDQTGTRRAPRFKMTTPSMVSTLRSRLARSASRATRQASASLKAWPDFPAPSPPSSVTPLALKPNQEIAMALPNADAIVRFHAKVAWTSFAPTPEGAPRYRAGIDFMDAEAAAVGAFIERHKA